MHFSSGITVLHCSVVKFGIRKIEIQPTNLYNKHQCVLSREDQTPRNQIDSIQYAMTLFSPRKTTELQILHMQFMLENVLEDPKAPHLS